MGGHSAEKEAADSEWRPTLIGFQDIVQTKAGKEYDQFVPVKFTQQVVAGNVFHVKY